MADERTEVAEIKSYIDELGNGFKADVEEHPAGSSKRTDLIVRYNNEILFNGEFKRPQTIEGKNPRSSELVDDAFLKSQKLLPPSRFFITSNFNETIIWDNKESDRPLLSRDIQVCTLTPLIKQDTDFTNDDIKEALKYKFQNLAKTILDLKNGKMKSEYRKLDESFIINLNSHLNAAVDTIYRYIQDKPLRKWWNDQGYEPLETVGDNEKKRMARFSLYVLANKIVFYYVLKRTFKNLSELDISNFTDIKEIKRYILTAFENAKEISGDYETVFENSVADEIPFYTDEMVFHVKDLIKFFELYNFSTLSQDILGNIYDTLISPKERHENGQYFTPIAVVDLINALTIKNRDDKVLDPACGSGTFLTRAFDFKLHLYKNRDDKVREKLVGDIYGVDIASYPAHLATMAIASKLGIRDPNIYPNIIRSDFLDIKPGIFQRLFGTKEHINIKTLGHKSATTSIDQLDAVIGNLPYIRQENINNKADEQTKVENNLQEGGYSPEKLNNTSDFHVYFWYDILPFLHNGSRVGFLTSDTWLNVDYGDDLKKFINKYFKIIAIIDSSTERYFPDALVNTVITVLEKTTDNEARQNNKIKFIRIHKGVGELIKTLDSAIDIAKKIESGKTSNDIQVIREVKQRDINFNDKLKSKLFPYLRAPKEFFELVNNENMVPLDNIMNISFGIKTGVNGFFYVEDLSDSYPEDKLKLHWGITRDELKTLRVIRDGTGQEHLIEKNYLKPILKGPKEFTKEGKLIFNSKTKKCLVLIEEDEKSKMGKYAKEYIEYGEKSEYDKRPSCKSRPYWWKLSPIVYPDLIFTMYFSSNFMYPKSNNLLDAQMYFGIMKEHSDNHLLSLYSFMNSSLSYLYPDMYGRNYGGGAVGFKVYEVKKLPVINPEILSPYYEQLKILMNKLESRKIGSVFEEIWDGKGEFALNKVKEDRLDLDKLLLEALGITDTEKFLLKYYPAVINIVKERMEKAASIKNSATTKAKESLSKIADSIIKSIEIPNFPDDYIKNKEIKNMVTMNVSHNVKFGNDIYGIFVSSGKDKEHFNDTLKAKYVYYCLKNGSGNITIPDKSEIENILDSYENNIRKAMDKINTKIEEYTDNEIIAERIYKMCVNKLNLVETEKN